MFIPGKGEKKENVIIPFFSFTNKDIVSRDILLSTRQKALPVTASGQDLNNFHASAKPLPMKQLQGQLSVA